MWNNSALMAYVKEQSTIYGGTLLSRKPETPDNPLIRDRVKLDSLKLRLKLDEIQGDDPDNVLTGQIVDGITLGATNKPIPKDHSYSEGDIEEFLDFQNELEQWDKRRIEYLNRDDFHSYNSLEAPIMSVLYHTDSQNTILVFNSDENYITSMGIEEMDDLISDRYRNRAINFRRSSFDEIDNYLINVEFDDLRKRLLNSGYSQYVQQITDYLVSNSYI